MPLNSNALVTLNDAKTYLSIPLADPAFDARVEQLINSASQLIEDHCDRQFRFQTYTTRRDGRRADRLTLEQWPVSEVVNLWDDPSWEFSSQSLVDPTEYNIEEETIIVLKAGRKFFRANQNIQVEYKAGYRLPGQTEGPSLPASLSLGCLMLVQWLDTMRQDRRIGVSSKGKQGESISFTEQGMPMVVEKLLADFVRYEIPLLDALTGNS